MLNISTKKDFRNIRYLVLKIIQDCFIDKLHQLSGNWSVNNSEQSASILYDVRGVKDSVEDDQQKVVHYQRLGNVVLVQV